MTDIQIIKDELFKSLSQKRFNHSLCVAKRAVELAKIYNQSEENIGLFGSLKHLKHYSFASLVVWFILIIGFYITGIPLGPGSLAGVSYVA